jgi:Protein of unknown function (DUF1552)
MKNILNRRRVLRGIFQGTTIAVSLPRLEMMLNNNGTAWAQTGTPVPRRFGVWAKANGVHINDWVPKQTGKAYTIPPQLAPLAPVRDHFSVLSGLDLPDIGQQALRGHCGQHTILMNGVGMATSPTTIWVTGKSIDQLVAEKLPAASRKSIHLGTSGGPPPEVESPFHWWSHNGKDSPNVCNYNCREVFDMLFKGAKLPQPGTPTPPAAPGGIDVTAKAKQSVLDYCKQDADDLLKIVGTADKRRLNQHLEGIFEIEQRLKAATAAGMEAGVLDPNGQVKVSNCSMPVEPSIALIGGTSGDYNANVRLINKTMAQLLAMALACDITRVFTFETMQPGCRTNVKSISGRDDSYHGLSHGGPDDVNYVKVQVAMMDELRIFIEILRDTNDGAGSLLDSTVVLASDCTNEGPSHGLTDFPMLMVGGKSAGLRLGEHIRFNRGNGLRVPLTLARAAGAGLSRFGTDSGVTESFSELMS